MIESNLRLIREQITAAAAGRDVKLIGASKTVEPARIQEAYDAGLHCFGENRMQEAIAKIPQLPGDIEWHFIGHLQSNKVRDAVRYFAWIHSIDSPRLLTFVHKEAEKQQKVVNVLAEINVGEEETKHGARPEQLPEILRVGEMLPYVRLCGLMAIPPFFDDPERTRPYFRKLRELASLHPALTHLSMGMSQDYAVAIQEGATMVRVGTSLFGVRPAKKNSPDTNRL